MKYSQLYRLITGVTLGLLFLQVSSCSEQTKSPLAPTDLPPRLIERPNPTYPQQGLDFCIEGVVALRVLVDTAGNVIDVVLLEESGSFIGFEEAAVSTAWQARFAPAIQAGKQIEAWAILNYRFEPDEDCDPQECEFGSQLIPPRFIEKVKPIYPRLAQQAGIEGTVFVSVLVDITGAVINVIIAKSSGTNAGFEQASIEAALKTTFRPAVKCGGPIMIWVTYDYRFSLSGG